jgi:hypothetical protein
VSALVLGTSQFSVKIVHWSRRRSLIGLSADLCTRGLQWLALRQRDSLSWVGTEIDQALDPQL